jgi:biopolymer transport protein ExbB/TolQ
MKKIDITVVTEVLGVALFATGVAMISIPAAFITVGAFLIWITEK